MSLPSIKVINNYKTLFLVCSSRQPPVISIFPQTSLSSNGTSSYSPLHNPFPVMSLCHLGYCVSFCCSSIGGSLVGNVLLIGSGFHMLHFHMFIVGYFLTLNVRGLVYCVQYMPYSVQLHIAYSYCMHFPFFDVWFNIV